MTSISIAFNAIQVFKAQITDLLKTTNNTDGAEKNELYWDIQAEIERRQAQLTTIAETKPRRGERQRLTDTQRDDVTIGFSSVLELILLCHKRKCRFIELQCGQCPRTRARQALSWKRNVVIESAT